MIGKTIAHYQITELLGSGGMGEVYRATDTKLNRDVALKILPEEFAADAQRMGRFQREAEVLASLDHPNIGAIHGIEESGKTKALVLQLVEGPTLADRIAQGPIPVEEALKIALQIAEGLEAAHEKGVIHRDLKPANIKITPSGQVKILDFGLAKAMEGDPSSPDMSQSPTLSMQATQAGVILGTAAYMSPEQARGETTDKRTDIWAFGCGLFEMLTGHGTFDGGTVSDVLAGVLRVEPKWDQLPADLHPRIPYESNESGRYEVYLQPFPGPGQKWQISTTGGIQPLWARNGRELFYRNGSRMMAVEIATDPVFRAGTPTILFEGQYRFGSGGMANYDVSPDGRSFLMVKSEKGAVPTELNVVLNWFEELKRLVPTDWP